MGDLYPVTGIKMSAVSAGIKQADRLDCVLFELAESSTVSAVFTKNAFCAAPVVVCKANLSEADTRFLFTNTGNANAGTGEKGLNDARTTCIKIAEIAGVNPEQVLPFSTGVIGESLPMEKILVTIPESFSQLVTSDWLRCAKGIMTTDTRPKACSVKLQYNGKEVTITGIAKGSGMIKPDMATMLAYIFTDAEISKDCLDVLVKKATDASFNRITIDGDTSTNDSVVLVATGKSGITLDHDKKFERALIDVFQQLAQMIVKDGEGASKFITVNVEQGASQDECLNTAYTVSHSPLIKTAFFASDPNWGRILAAVGRAGIKNFDINKVSIFLDDVCIVKNGAVANEYTEQQGQAIMDQEEITVQILLGRGNYSETVWTSDLSHDYVTINAEYRT